MSRESPVFIVGVNRSGTTALRSTLDRHPAFRSRRDVSPETNVFETPERVFKLHKRVGRRALGYLLEDEDVVRDLRRQLGPRWVWQYGWRGWVDFWSDRSESEVSRVRRWRIQGHHHQLRAFFHAASTARGCRRLLEKTPKHVHFLPELFETFPRARVLMCIRHPVEVYSSLKKRLQRERLEGSDPGRGDWQSIDVEEFVRRYDQIATISLEWAASCPDRCRLVRYEALTADPRRELCSICGFLGEPFDEEALLGSSRIVRDASGSPAPEGRLAENQKRWRDFISEDDATAIEAGLAEPMARLGYESVATREGR